MDVATLSTVLDSALKSMQDEGCSLRNFRLERGARCTTITIEFVHIANQTWFEGDETERSLQVCHCGKSLSSSRETVSDKVVVDGSDNMSLTSDESQVLTVVTCDIEQKPSGRNSVDKGCNTDSEPDTMGVISETKSTKETSPVPTTEPVPTVSETMPTITDMPTINVIQQDMDAETKCMEGYEKSKGRSMSTTSDCLMPNQDEVKRRKDYGKSKQRSLSITIDELQNKESMQLKDDGKAKHHSPLLKPNKNKAEPSSPKNKQKPSKQMQTISVKTKENKSPASAKPPVPGPMPVAPPVAPPAAEADNDESDEDEDVLISQVVKKWSAIRGKKGLF